MRWLRRILGLAFVAYAASLTYLLFNPSPANIRLPGYAFVHDTNAGIVTLIGTWTLEENAANMGDYGYFPTDLTGDGGSDSLDMTVIENNGNAGVFEARP